MKYFSSLCKLLILGALVAVTGCAAGSRYNVLRQAENGASLEVDSDSNGKVDIAYGGTNAGTATDARTNLGVAIGTDVEGFNTYLSQIAGLSPSQGDIMYYNGSNWVLLPAGTSGYFLETQGTGANPIWAAGGSGSGDVSVSGTPSQYDWATWADSTSIEGITVTGSSVVCSDSNGLPTACSNLSDSDYAASTVIADTLGTDYDTEAKLKALMSITQTVSVADAGTLTPTAGYHEVDIALTPTSAISAITLSETGAINNEIVIVTNVGSNIATFAYSAGNFEFNGGSGKSIELDAGQSFFAQYQTDRWRVLENNGATLFMSAIDSEVSIPDAFCVAASDETTDLTTGTAKLTFRMPYAMTLDSDGVRLSVNTAPVGSTIIADVNESGTTIFSTNPSIDASSKTSVGATTPEVISDTALADDAEMTIDIDQVGSTTAGKGLKVCFRGTRSW